MPLRATVHAADRLIKSESLRRRVLRFLGAFTGLSAIGGPIAILGGCGGGGGGGAPPVMPSDSIAPTVSATSPINAATGVALNSLVSATFSEPMTNATLTIASFTLVPTLGGPTVAGTVNVIGNTATFTPSLNLAKSTQYTATITTAAQDAAGNALATNFSWSFTTPVPGLGAHNLVFNRLGTAANPVSTLPIDTQASGSTILVCVGRGVIGSMALPTDNKVNTYAEQDSANSPHTYTLFAGSGTALAAVASATGGNGHVVTEANTNDEVTLAVVEVMNGGNVQAVWKEVVQPQPPTPPTQLPLTSLSVTTAGPATLVAFWWGDADGTQPHTAFPNNGFTVIDSVLLSGNLVQCAVATKDVSVAGTYNVTWTASQLQGAQLWLVAVESA